MIRLRHLLGLDHVLDAGHGSSDNLVLNGDSRRVAAASRHIFAFVHEHDAVNSVPSTAVAVPSRRRALAASFFACKCENEGKCTPRNPETKELMCPAGYHVDINACKPKRIYQYISGYGCAKPPPEEDPQEPADLNNPLALDQKQDPDQCGEKDKPINNFTLHDKNFRDKGHPITCEALWRKGACDDPTRPLLSSKVRGECPCMCGIAPPEPKPLPPPYVPDAEYTQQRLRETPCNVVNFDFWNKVELRNDKGHIVVNKMDTTIEGGACGVNKSPRHSGDACKKKWFLFPKSYYGDKRDGPQYNDYGCTGHPMFDVGVRVDSELIEVDGDKKEWHKWGTDVFKNLNPSYCHRLVFQGPDPMGMQAARCNLLGPYREPSNWAPEECRGMGFCPEDHLCCVKHKNVEKGEDVHLFFGDCKNVNHCKDSPVCDMSPMNEICKSQVGPT